MNPDVTNYISQVEQQWQKTILEELRSTVFAANAAIEEKIKWGSIGYDFYGPLLWAFTAQKWVHISFSHGALLDQSHGLFEKTDNKAQRTIKLQQTDTFPTATVLALTKEASENNQKGKKVSFNQSRSEKKEFSLPKEFQTLLGKKQLLDAYSKRPFYQQSGWIRWIESAKKPQTRLRRIEQMLDELRAGDAYMKMPW